MHVSGMYSSILTPAFTQRLRSDSRTLTSDTNVRCGSLSVGGVLLVMCDTCYNISRVGDAGGCRGSARTHDRARLLLHARCVPTERTPSVSEDGARGTNEPHTCDE